MQRRGVKGTGKEIVLKAKKKASWRKKKSQASYSPEHIQYSDQLAETKVDPRAWTGFYKCTQHVCSCVSDECESINKQSYSKKEEVEIRFDIRRGKR